MVQLGFIIALIIFFAPVIGLYTLIMRWNLPSVLNILGLYIRVPGYTSNYLMIVLVFFGIWAGLILLVYFLEFKQEIRLLEKIGIKGGFLFSTRGLFFLRKLTVYFSSIALGISIGKIFLKWFFIIILWVVRSLSTLFSWPLGNIASRLMMVIQFFSRPILSADYEIILVFVSAGFLIANLITEIWEKPISYEADVYRFQRKRWRENTELVVPDHQKIEIDLN
jgi:hypothetical protein